MIEYYKSSTVYADFLRETDSSEYLIYVGMFERFVRPASGQVLDIGCGTGASTMLLRQRGLDAIGTDVSERFLPRGQSGFRAIDFLDARELTANSYAAAGCHDVIEHVESPRQFLSEMVRVVKPGGHVVICAPNLTSPMVAARVVLDVLHKRTPYLGIESLAAALGLLLASPYHCLRAALRVDAFRMRPPALQSGIVGYDADAIYWANPAEIRRFLEAQGCEVVWYQRQGRSAIARLIARYLPSFAGQICIVARKS